MQPLELYDVFIIFETNATVILSFTRHSTGYQTELGQ